jgi:hypothetical protein
MKDHRSLKTLLQRYQENDKENKEKYEDSFISFVLEDIRHQKEKISKLQEEYDTCYLQAKEKVSHLKSICKEILGWEINEKGNIVEMRSIFVDESDDPFVVERTDEGKYVLLDAKNNSKHTSALAEHKALYELLDISKPLFFAYFTVFMRPDIKEIFLVL